MPCASARCIGIKCSSRNSCKTSKSEPIVDQNAKKSRKATLSLKRVRNQIRKKLKWDKSRIESAEKEYRKFLALVGTSQKKEYRPTSEDMDQFWHFHILDTTKYIKDCQVLFGFYLHHIPE